MEDQPLSIPLREVINFVTLIQALIFAAILSVRPSHNDIARWFLVAALVIMAATKFDQLFQMLGGLKNYPQFGFALAPLQALMTPALYLYVTAKTQPDFKIGKSHLWHATPFVLMLAYLFVVYYRLDISEKSALLASGGFSSPLHRFVVPIIGDIVQFSYVIAAYLRLEKYGVSIKNWFSHVENRDLRWLKRLMMMWGAVFIFHSIWTVSAGLFGALPFARNVLDALNIIHLVMVNAIMLMGVTAPVKLEGSVEQKNASPKYAASSLTQHQREALFQKTVSAMQTEQLYLNPDLTLRQLADQVSATPRELSEAINGEGEGSFFVFINNARVEHAQRLLLEFPETRILDIAFQSGFNSKTAFNEAFRKASGMTPSGFRKKHCSSPPEGQSAEKLA